MLSENILSDNIMLMFKADNMMLSDNIILSDNIMLLDKPCAIN
jgi:hypothetical protein